jgi:hypothetical protein
MTRVRLETVPPLPTLKAWFPINDSPTSVSALKRSLCASLSALEKFGLKAGQLDIEIDGFALLDELPMEGLIKDGDLLTLKAQSLRRRIHDESVYMCSICHAT